MTPPRAIVACRAWGVCRTAPGSSGHGSSYEVLLPVAVVAVVEAAVAAAARGERAMGGPQNTFRDGSIGAPMPGVVVDVKAAIGDEIVEGAPLFVLSAMKVRWRATTTSSPRNYE